MSLRKLLFNDGFECLKFNFSLWTFNTIHIAMPSTIFVEYSPTIFITCQRKFDQIVYCLVVMSRRDNPIKKLCLNKDKKKF